MGGQLESKLPPQAAEEPPYPTASRAWYVLGLLTLVYVFSVSRSHDTELARCSDTPRSSHH